MQPHSREDTTDDVLNGLGVVLAAYELVAGVGKGTESERASSGSRGSSEMGRRAVSGTQPQGGPDGQPREYDRRRHGF